MTTLVKQGANIYEEQGPERTSHGGRTCPTGDTQRNRGGSAEANVGDQEVTS